MLDACTVLFVGANALAVGLISARVLEVIGMGSQPCIHPFLSH